MPHPLPLTGERTLPGVPGEDYWFARHEAVYRWVVERYADRLRDGVVVEAGSGEGYGARMLHDAGARLVLALELDEAAARHAATAYPAVTTSRANLAALPVADASADLLVCLQVVEHLWDLAAFLRDCRRVLRPGGVAVVSTPNRPVFSPGLGRGEKPTNPFHVEELDAEQLDERLRAAGFADVDVRGLHHGGRIAAWESAGGTGIVAAQVAVVTGSGLVPDDLDAFVSTVTVDDFEVGDAEGSQDLVAVAVAP
ncbi:MAG: methyltransferase domain-containing protein [Candidatus Nanopelagicales bacterium]